MPDVISSNRIEAPSFMRLGSSSIDGEDKDLLNLFYGMTEGYRPSGYYDFSFDVVSHLESTLPFMENETYKYREIIPEEMIEHDIFVKMPPKRRRTVKFKIRRIRRAKPRIVIPEYPYIDI